MANATFGDKSGPGGIVYNPASAYAKEMAKWEMGYSPYGPPGRPREVYGNQEWPKAFYKMRRSPTNGDFLVDNFIACESPAQAATLEAQGYRLGREAAEAYVVELEQMVAVAAAERAKSDLRMSEKAKAEAQAADDATSQHVGAVPETPIKRRGRPVKIQTE
jgi:hypothetical protein